MTKNMFNPILKQTKSYIYLVNIALGNCNNPYQDKFDKSVESCVMELHDQTMSKEAIPMESSIY